MRNQTGGWLRVLGMGLLAVGAGGISGCGMLGGGQQQAYPVPAQYTGLADKSVAIVVFAMPATIDEFSGSREEISAFIANQMRLNMPTTRVLDPQRVIEWQNNTINWFGLSEMDIGKHFQVDRVLSIRMLDYSTHKSMGYSDMQGHVKAQAKVVEVDAPDRKSMTGWSGVVDVTWPPDRPLDPTQTNENAVRQRILELFSTDLVRYFYDHIEQVGGEGIRARSH